MSAHFDVFPKKSHCLWLKTKSKRTMNDAATGGFDQNWSVILVICGIAIRLKNAFLPGRTPKVQERPELTQMSTFLGTEASSKQEKLALTSNKIRNMSFGISNFPGYGCLSGKKVFFVLFSCIRMQYFFFLSCFQRFTKSRNLRYG